MSKPTLVQSFLHKPSQTYRNVDPAPKKEYYSTKQEMMRIAAESNPPSSSRAPAAAPVERRRPTRPFPIVESDSDDDDDDDDSSSDLDVFFTPNTSPRTSMASSAATFRRPSRRSLHADPPLPLQLPPDLPAVSPTLIAVPSTRTPSTGNSGQTRAQHTLSSSSSLSSTSLDAHSLFSDYLGSGESTILTTTDQSLSGHKKVEPKTRSTTTDARSKPHVTPADSTQSAAIHTRHKPTPLPNVAKPTTITENPTGPSSAKSTAGSKKAAYTHLGVGHAGNGDSIKSKETEQTTRPIKSSTTNGVGLPPANGSPVNKPPTPRHPHTFSAFASISPSTAITTPTTTSSSTTSSSRPMTKDTAPPTDNSTTPSPATVSPTKTDSRMTTPASATKATPPQTKHQRSQSTPSAGTSVASASSSTAKSQNTVSASTPSTKTATLRKKSPIVKPGSTLMPLSDMDAVLEEDEDGPLTPRMESRPLTDGSSTPDGWDWTSQSSPSNNGRSLRHTSARTTARPRSLDRDSFSSTSTTSTSRAHTRAPPKTLTAEVEALVSSFPVAGERPSKGTQGYSALILPRAPPTNALPNGRLHKPRPAGMVASGRIDLTLDGVAQTTMASVEVVRGLGARNAAGVLGKLGFGRKRVMSSGTAARGPAPLPLPAAATNGQPEGSDDLAGYGVPSLPAPGMDAQATPLAFTSYRAPPTHIPSGSVLVQVWAVGLDGVDARLVGCGFERAGLRQVGSESTGRPSGAEPETDAEDLGEERVRERHQERNGGESTGMEDTEDEQWDEPSTASRKGPLAALGRTISLRLSRGGSGKTKDKQSPSPSKKTPQRSSTVPAVTPPRPSNAKPTTTSTPSPRPDISLPKRSFSLKRHNAAASNSPVPATASSPSKQPKEKKAGIHVAEVGYIPGRSFVGRVLECGWDVSEDVVRKGEWVMGLLDVRKGGALTEFVVIDRHRIHRVPYPRMDDPYDNPPGDIPTSSSSLTLDELALLPLCGLPAYRAIRTFIFAFSPTHDARPPPEVTNYNTSSNTGPRYNRPLAEHVQGYKRRALVLRGHDGIGAMAVQMLVNRGWRVSVHVPFSSVPAHTPQDVSERFMHVVEQRARQWGADEVIFDDGEEGGMDDGRGAAVRVLESLREDGDIFDAVLDTVGGKIIWAAAERLLKFQGSAPGVGVDESRAAIRRRGVGQFTTLVGHTPERVIPTARDNLRAGLRALRMGSGNSTASGPTGGESSGSELKSHGKVGYAWISVAQDIDWEGDDVGQTLGTVLRLALDRGVRPLTEGVGMDGMQSRVVPFEQAPYLFVDNGPLTDGGTVVVAIA